MAHPMRSIRARLGVTQTDLAAGIACNQSNIAHYERGQAIPPHVARRLIAYAATLGVTLSFDQIYGGAELPPPRRIPATAGQGA
jgi:putative transcriptional regulator